MMCHDLLIKAQTENHNELQLLMSKFYLHIDDFCDALNKHIEQNSNYKFHYNEKLCEAVKQFFCDHHLVPTNKQADNIIRLSKGDGYIILFPYQPNLFASVSVMSPVVHMEQIKKIMLDKYHKNIVPIFLFVDYDNVQDRRFTKCYMPSLLGRYAKTFIGFPIDKSKKNDIMLSCLPPTKECLEHWIKQIKDNFNVLLKCIGKNFPIRAKLVRENLELEIERIRAQHLQANSFVEFNEIYMYDIFIHEWECSTLFIEGHVLNKSYLDLLLRINNDEEKISSCYQDAYNFLAEKRLKLSFKRTASCNLMWKYKEICEKRCKSFSPCYDNCKFDYCFPTVLSDYLLDYLMMGKVGAVGYYKQMEATIITDYILSQAYGMLPCPQLLTKVAIDPFGQCELKTEWFNMTGEKYNNYVAAATDSHCSILFPNILLGCKETKIAIENKKTII